MLYLDNAATTIQKPLSVYYTLFKDTIFSSGNAGRGIHKASTKAVRTIIDTQDIIAELFNISKPENIIFTQNATYALNTAILGSLTKNSHAIITQMEHNSVLRPIHILGNYTVISANKSGYVNASDIENAITPDTRLIVCTHASNVCGSIQPVYQIGKIAKKYGIPFLLDASQTAGSVKIDVDKMNIDMLAFSGHKGLLGPLGTGGIYIKNPETVTPIAVGGTGSLSEYVTQPEIMPDKFHSGTMNTPAIHALSEGVKFILKQKETSIGEYEKSLSDKFKESLLNMPEIAVYGGDYSVATVAFNVKGLTSEETVELLKNKVAIRAGYHCAPLAHKALGTEKTGAIRVSFGIFNSKSDVSKMTDYVYSIIKKHLGQ